jgi:2-aminoethylphosphonate dioxygenase
MGSAEIKTSNRSAPSTILGRDMDNAATRPAHGNSAVIPPITEVQRRRYIDDGYLILQDFFPRELLADATMDADRLLGRSELIHTDNLRCRWQDHVRSKECLFESFDPVNDLSPACARLSTDSRLLAALGVLYGEEACLFKDKLIFKPPGAKGYGLHQDYIAWPTFPRSFLTVIIPLDCPTAENGCTEVFAGYHKNGAMSAEDGDYHELPPDLVDPSRAVKLELEVGDIAIFSGFTPHRSSPNLSDSYRRQLYVSYNAISDGGNQRNRHYEIFLAWLRGKYAEFGRNNVYFR